MPVRPGTVTFEKQHSARSKSVPRLGTASPPRLATASPILTGAKQRGNTSRAQPSRSHSLSPTKCLHPVETKESPQPSRAVIYEAAWQRFVQARERARSINAQLAKKENEAFEMAMKRVRVTRELASGRSVATSGGIATASGSHEAIRGGSGRGTFGNDAGESEAVVVNVIQAVYGGV
ncbi:hypothetical protein BCR44DRAFT_1428074 [Catenaria anguillulae PL171]|uniref:Uncharacterized protein n=1 Tax=Catenaria anguillulae PL171 TaxID=765915 RepID=A0A1Y2HYW4_9FUNG|nr:hypothetical protein BCR44DRAFT_1428074 [Catenaria anguillulae PL171]